ncbi:MAG: hypothetical protein JNL21_05445 [Myxococcales bacterium]|nr:hypothetical protein [Myxococcales bacterium]
MTRSTALACGLVLLASCGPKGGTDVGNGATVKLNVRGYEQPTMGGAQSVTLENGVELDSVWIAVEKVKLRAGEDCSGGSDPPVDFEGPAIADLLGAGVVNDVPQFDVEAGSYCRLHVSLHRVDATELPPSAPAELAGSSVVVLGRRADGVPFTIRTKQSFELKLDARGGVPFELSGEEALILGFELRALIDAVELDSFSGPEIVIDDDTAPPVIARFDQAIRKSASLFDDQNADGGLSPSERDGAEIAEGQ